MKQSQKILVAVGLAAVIIVAGIAVLGMRGTKSTAKTPPAASSMSASEMNAMAGHESHTSAATNAISIDDYMFMPMSATVKVGDTVTWTNKDSVHHNVVADTASADAPNGPLIGQGETYKFTFTKAGTYSYHCEPHSYMHGTVIVSE